MYHARSASSHRFGFGLLLATGLGAAGLLACSSDGDTTDAGADAGRSDSGGAIDAGLLDSGSPDVGTPDSGPALDAGHYCVASDRITVGATAVTLTGDPTRTPLSISGAGSMTTCIDQPPAAAIFNAAIFIRGCVDIADSTASPTTDAQLDQLDFAVFRSRDASSQATNPSFNRTTFVDRQPSAKLSTAFVLNKTVATSVCSSGVQVEIGFDSAANPALDTLESEVEYIVRIRGGVSAPDVWLPTYHFAVTVRNDNIVGAGADLDRCNTQNCYLRRDFVAVRQAWVREIISARGATITGSQDLADGVGPGYAAIETFDCQDRAMRHAVAGFSPTPQASGYLSDSTGLMDSSFTETDQSGVFLGLGFTGTSSMANFPVTGAVGVTRDGSCNESFGGSTVFVYSDSISLMRSGRETVLHDR